MFFNKTCYSLYIGLVLLGRFSRLVFISGRIRALKSLLNLNPRHCSCPKSRVRIPNNFRRVPQHQEISQIVAKKVYIANTTQSICILHMHSSQKNTTITNPQWLTESIFNIQTTLASSTSNGPLPALPSFATLSASSKSDSNPSFIDKYRPDQSLKHINAWMVAEWRQFHK